MPLHPIDFTTWTPTEAEAQQMREAMEALYIPDEEYDVLWWQLVREKRGFSVIVFEN